MEEFVPLIGCAEQPGFPCTSLAVEQAHLKCLFALKLCPHGVVSAWGQESGQKVLSPSQVP